MPSTSTCPDTVDHGPRRPLRATTDGKADGAAQAKFVPDQTTLAILAVFATGTTPADTAAACGVSTRTVRRKLAHARSGWGARTNIEAVVRAVRAGLI